jgi:DNA ligase D-like protein (predicted ligase)
MSRTSPKQPKAGFIEPMESLLVSKLPEGPTWTYEIKLDGYRLEIVKNAGATVLYSRRANPFNRRFPTIADAFPKLPDATVIDGEVVALDKRGHPDFQVLQNVTSGQARLHYYAFDILVLKGRSLLRLPLEERRLILADSLPQNDRVTLSLVDLGPASHMMRFVRDNALEGVVAKRADSEYEPGKRSGLWSKLRIDRGQEFVVGGYTPGSYGFDAILVGFFRGRNLIFAGSVRAGFVPGSRREVFKRLKPLIAAKSPFVNLADKTPGRWGQGITAEKMKVCTWLKPEVVVRIDFREWTDGERLRHTKFIGIRDDKDPRKVAREI